MTYKANISTSVHPIDQFSYSIMFDSERIPTDRFSYFGKEGDYDKWKGTDKGVDVSTISTQRVLSIRWILSMRI